MPSPHVVLLQTLARIVVAETCRPKAPELSPIQETTTAPRPPSVSPRQSPQGARQVSTSSPLAASQPDLPTTPETVAELRRRLGKELYRYEGDLAAGGRIAGKPCSCLSHKHNLGLEAMTEELIPMDPAGTPLYNQIVSWVKSHEAEFEPAEIAKRPPEYYQALAPAVRNFRSKVMGTQGLGALLTEQERSQVMTKIKEQVQAGVK